MSYPDFNPVKPDPSVDNGSAAFTGTRQNLLALRDAALSGMLLDWSLALSGGTAAQRTTWMYSKGTERVRVVITWGTSGGPSGKPQTLQVSYSANSGSTWTVLGTSTITYDASGNLTGASGLAPGLASHFLLGVQERARLIEASVASLSSSTDSALAALAGDIDAVEAAAASAVALRLLASSNLGDLTNVSAARTALGLNNVTVTAVNKTLVDREFCTVTASGRTITLPASPTTGMLVFISVLSFSNTVIGRNSQNIMGLAENMTIDRPNVTVGLRFVDTTRGWRIL